MPDLVCNDLIFRALPNNAYFFCLFALVKGIKISAIEQDLAASAAMRRENGFELPQKRTFAAARGTAKHQKLAWLDGQRQVRECVLLLLRICEGQISDRKDFHCLSSFRSRITGVRTSAR